MPNHQTLHGSPFHRIPIRHPAGGHITASNRRRLVRPHPEPCIRTLPVRGHTPCVLRRLPPSLRYLRSPFLSRCLRWNVSLVCTDSGFVPLFTRPSQRRPSHPRIPDRRCQRQRHSHLRRSFSMWCAMRHYWHPSRFHIVHPRSLTVLNFLIPTRIFHIRPTRDRARSESAHETDTMTSLAPLLLLSDVPPSPYSEDSTASGPSAGFQNDLTSVRCIPLFLFFHITFIPHPIFVHFIVRCPNIPQSPRDRSLSAGSR